MARVTTGSAMTPFYLWLGSPFCPRAASVGVPTAKQSIVDLSALANRNFGLGSLFSFALGLGLYGLAYLYPLYLGMIRGYRALMIAETVFVSGFVMVLTAPVAGRLLLFAVGTWWISY
jgi:hypothetical protein